MAIILFIIQLIKNELLQKETRKVLIGLRPMTERFFACKRLKCTYEFDIIDNQGINKGIKVYTH